MRLRKTTAEIDDFGDYLIGLAEYRPKADALEENMPPPRDWIFESFLEGRRIFRLQRARAHPQADQRGEDACHGARRGLCCSCCNFDFGVMYGQVGEGYIEAHHTKPLSSLDESGGMTRIKELALVCANCHRMFHRRRPWLGPEKLTKIVQR